MGAWYILAGGRPPPLLLPMGPGRPGRSGLLLPDALPILGATVAGERLELTDADEGRLRPDGSPEGR